MLLKANVQIIVNLSKTIFSSAVSSLWMSLSKEFLTSVTVFHLRIPTDSCPDLCIFTECFHLYAEFSHHCTHDVYPFVRLLSILVIAMLNSLSDCPKICVIYESASVKYFAS